MLSVGGNNYRPPLERSKSAPKLMAIEEAIGEEDEDTNEQDSNEDDVLPRLKNRYPAMTLGRRSWMIKNREIVEEEPEAEIEVEETDDYQHEDIDVRLEIDEIVQEQSFKLSPSTSHYEDESDMEGEQEDHTSHGLEGEIMSYFDKKLNERSVSMNLGDQRLITEEKLKNLSLDCLLDSDQIISQIIRSQSLTPSFRDGTSEFRKSSENGLRISEPFDRDRNNLTPGAASESDEPESGSRFRIINDNEETVSDESLASSINDHHLGLMSINLASQFSQESQLEMDLKRLPCEEYFTNTTLDSDSDVSDESGFIEYHQESHQKFENRSPKLVKSVLV